MNQEKLKVKIKRLHPEAVIPTYAKPGDAGMDLTATSKWFDEYGNVCYGFGLAFEIPEGYVGLIFPRSSCCKVDLTLSNCVGAVDSCFRGEVSAKFKPALAFTDWNSCSPKKSDSYDYVSTPGDNKIFGVEAEHYNVGDRIAQMIIMPFPKVEFEEVDELSETERNIGSYGSTGK